MNRVYVKGIITDFTDTALKIQVDDELITILYHPNTFTNTFEKGQEVEIQGRLVDIFGELKVKAERII